MAATIRIPTPLRKFTDGKSEVDVEGGTVREIFDDVVIDEQLLAVDDHRIANGLVVKVLEKARRGLQGLGLCRCTTKAGCQCRQEKQSNKHDVFSAGADGQRAAGGDPTRREWSRQGGCGIEGA